MLDSIRTYRLLRFLVASTLVVGFALPLVRHACAMTGMAMTAPVSAHETCHGHEADRPAEDCPAGEHCTAHLEKTACCTKESVQAGKASLSESKLKLAHVLLPVVAFLSTTRTNSAPTYTSSVAHALYGDSSGGVPLRVLHASFLL